jgi:formylglycine-generating enzyme required for sulfatase activity
MPNKPVIAPSWFPASLVFPPLALTLLAAAIWNAPPRNPQASHEATLGGSPPSDAFGPTLPNSVAAPGPAPDGMVWIPGREFSMGAADPPEKDPGQPKRSIAAGHPSAPINTAPGISWTPVERVK